VDNLVSVEEIDREKDLLDGFGGILLGELSLFANAIEQLSSCRELCYNVELVLRTALARNRH
jgi:hypothetical protein